MRLLAMVTEPKSVTRYLRALEEPTEAPARASARGPPYWKSRVLRRASATRPQSNATPVAEQRFAPRPARAPIRPLRPPIRGCPAEPHPPAPPALSASSYILSWAAKRVDAYDRIARLYALFGWGPPPLTRSEVELALGLKYEERSLLEAVPSSGTFSMPRLIVKTATSNVTLAQLAATLEKLAVFGVQGPRPDDRYLGVTWSDAVAMTSRPSSA